ncbi:MAG TPA: hypothetical protein VL463_32335 [Kofleriaceae bacterium]|nr:hypothetical protein [Kofleriaceae bacterium]
MTVATRDGAGAWLRRAGWFLLALPALWQLVTLSWAIVHRVGYPYDLEWMEGGMLHHAQRISEGTGIYGPPTVDFIPYLYTPLYPGLLAVLGSIFGLSFALGRMVSVLSLCGIAVVVGAAIAGPARRAARAGADDRFAAWLGVLTALGLFAAGYPWTGGWYDLVRNDSFFLALVTVGLHCTIRWARLGTGWAGQGRTAAAAAILGLSFFAKQTGVVYVGGGAVIVLALNWRRVPIFVATAGAIGLGGKAILQRATGDWFWIWVHDVHQSHDFQMPRFWHSIRLLLGHFPLATTAIVLGLILVAACAIAKRQVPKAARPLLVWAPIWLLSIVVGGIGFGTQWAVFNAYMPALLHGGIACGCAMVAVASCARVLMPTELARRRFALIAPVVVIALAPGIDLWRARWSASDFIPSDADRAAGDALIARISQIDGDVWVTFDPWMAHLAGKRMYTHRMGVGDAGAGKKPIDVVGLDEALRDHRFAAIVLDDHGPFSSIAAFYRADDALPKEERPRLFVGITTSEGTPGQLRPASIWVPATPSKPPIGARALFDFENGSFDGWTPTGAAWGTHPESRELSGQSPVYRFRGRYFADSMHGGDKATGSLTSKDFPIDGLRISFLIAGGTDRGLRAELWVEGKPVRVAGPPKATDTMSEVKWDVSPFRGKTANLVLVDEATDPWGHMEIDDVLIWNDPSSTPKQ